MAQPPSNPNQVQARQGFKSSESRLEPQLQPGRQTSEVPPGVSQTFETTPKFERLPGFGEKLIQELKFVGDPSLVDFLVEALFGYKVTLVGLRARRELELEHPPQSQGFNPAPTSASMTRLQHVDLGVTQCEQLIAALEPFKTPIKAEDKPA